MVLLLKEVYICLNRHW